MRIFFRHRRNGSAFYSSIIISVFLAFGWVILPGFAIYTGNRGDFFGETFDVLKINLYIAAALGLICTVMALSCSARNRQNALVGYFGVGLFAWVKSSFLVGDLPHIDGSPFIVSWDWGIISLEIVFLSCLVAPLVVASSKISMKTLTLICAVFVAVQTGAFFLEMSHATQASVSSGDMARRDGSELTKKTYPNIYHIIFDGFQGTYFNKLAVDRTDGQAELDGFTVFTDAVAQSNRTALSLPGFLTGESYRSSNISGYMRRSFCETGLWPLLVKSGYALHIHGQYDEYSCSDVSFFENLRRSTFGTVRAGNEALTLLELSVLRVLPRAVSATLYSDGRRFAESHDPDAVELSEWPYYDVLGFRKFMQDVALRPKRNSYHFIHVLLPHGPQVMDRECRYRGPQPKVSDSDLTSLYTEQAACAYSLLTEFVDTLKEEGLYRDSIILVHGDHGYGRRMELRNLERVPGGELDKLAQNNRSWRLEGVAAWASIAMAVKPSGRGEGDDVKVNSGPVEGTQLFATVYELLGIDGGAPGYSMFRKDIAPDRVRYFWLVGDVGIRDETLPAHDQYVIRGPHDVATSWSFDGSVPLPRDD